MSRGFEGLEGVNALDQRWLWVAPSKSNVDYERNPAIVEDSLSKVSSTPSRSATKAKTHAADFDNFADTFLEINRKKKGLDELS